MGQFASFWSERKFIFILLNKKIKKKDVNTLPFLSLFFYTTNIQREYENI